MNGFCVFNNVGIGARYLQERYGHKKIAIFDWDIHHGDGTQKIFYDDPDILFISIHRYDNGQFYPFCEEGHVSRQGSGKGKGFNINISLNYCDENMKEYRFQSPGDN